MWSRKNMEKNNMKNIFHIVYDEKYYLKNICKGFFSS